jgi:hypothetical protein
MKLLLALSFLKTSISLLSSLFSYDFLYHECLNNEFRENSTFVVSSNGRFSSFTLNPHPQCKPCLRSNGVPENSNLVSQKSIETIKSALTSSFAFEFWIKPRRNLIDDDIVVLSIDSDTKSCSSSVQFVQTSVSSSFSSASSSFVQFSLLFCNKYGSSGYLSSPVLSPPLTAHNESKLMHIIANVEFSNFTLPSSKGTPIKLFDVTVSYIIDGVSYTDQSVTATSVTTSYLPRTWSSTALVHVFPTSHIPDCFSPFSSSSASLYRLALYPVALSFSEQQLLYSSPLPFNPFFTSNVTVTVQENGQIGDHSTDPSYFLRDSMIPNNSLPIVSFHVYSFDFDPINPFSPMNIQRMKETEERRNHSSIMIELFPASSSFSSSLKVLKGELYNFDGTPLSAKSDSSSALTLPVQQVGEEHPTNGEFSLSLRYRPPFNQFSSLSSVQANLPFTMFPYRAYDSYLGISSEAMGNVAIFIQQVYKPPSPAFDLSATGLPRTLIPLTLSGYVDKVQNEPNNKIIIALVASSPSFGQLFSTTGEEITAFPHYLSLSLASTTHDHHLSYYYTGPEEGKSIVGVDSFSFGVIDAFNLSSISTNYSLIIRNALSVDSTSLSFTCNENDDDDNSTVPNLITLKGKDLSSEIRKVRLRILSFPAFGSFVELSGSDSASQQQRFFFDTHPLTFANYSSGIILHYQQTKKDYFTFPRKTWENQTISGSFLPDSFSYQVEIFGSKISGKSQPVTATIAIRNVNDPTLIYFQNVGSSSSVTSSAAIAVSSSSVVVRPPSAVSSTASTSVVSQSISLTLPVTSPTEYLYHGIALNGFSLFDPDLGLHPIRIQVNTSNKGLLRLNTSLPWIREKVDFNSNAYCFGQNKQKWSCQGSTSASSSNLIFIASPLIVQQVLNGMIYRKDPLAATSSSTSAMMKENITITLFDGIVSFRYFFCIFPSFIVSLPFFFVCFPLFSVSVFLLFLTVFMLVFCLICCRVISVLRKSN